MTSLGQILSLILDIALWIIIAHIIMSWLINFQVLNLRQPLRRADLGRAEPPFGARFTARSAATFPARSGLDLGPPRRADRDLCPADPDPQQPLNPFTLP